MKAAPEVRRQLGALARADEAEVDTADIPEVLDWSLAERGRFYRPVKQIVTIRLDTDIIAWFRARDRKYQTAVNRALREYMMTRSAEQAETGRSTPRAARRKRAGRQKG